MEDEDFGFTTRHERVLQRVLTVGQESRAGEKNGAATRGVAGDAGPTPETAPTTGTSAATTAAPSGVAGPAGSGAREREPASCSSSVAPGPPNIPNVVEYHLKVKPRSATSVRGLDDNTRNDNTEEMKKEKSPVSSTEKKKDLVSKLSKLSIDNNVFEGSTDLPQVFRVKYLGSHDARGLWGIKHTRRPVDNMVAAAKSLPTNTMLPLIKLVVSQDGVALLPLDKRKQETSSARMYPIETISYGVQDLVYTRVFSMIVVRETDNFRRVSPFECHGFVCESKHHARQLTYALATAFEIYSRAVRAQDQSHDGPGKLAKKRFAIDLRSPEEIEADLAMDSEA